MIKLKYKLYFKMFHSMALKYYIFQFWRKFILSGIRYKKRRCVLCTKFQELIGFFISPNIFYHLWACDTVQLFYLQQNVRLRRFLNSTNHLCHRPIICNTPKEQPEKPHIIGRNSLRKSVYLVWYHNNSGKDKPT